MDTPVNQVDRRTFLLGLAATTGATSVSAQAAPIPIIDTHIHLFDQTRPQGAPYSGGRPPGSTTPTLPALPPRYRTLARPMGIVGAIEVEASNWIEDNLWVLEVAETDTMMVGTIGNLEPEKPEFAEYLDRYRRNPLFRGIRCGNLWGRDIVRQSQDAAFIAGLKRLSAAGLVLDTANPRVDLLQAMVRISDQVPDLRIVIDHSPNLWPAPGDQAAYERVLAEIGQRPNLVTKISAVVRRVNGQVSWDVATYRDRLDYLIGIFGEDRILFGTDWPNSDGVGPVDRIVSVVKEYFSTRPRSLQEKYYWKNSVSVYRWIKRAPDQPTLFE